MSSIMITNEKKIIKATSNFAFVKKKTNFEFIFLFSSNKSNRIISPFNSLINNK